MDHLLAALVLHRLDAPAALADGARDGAEVVLRHRDLDVHHGLEQLGLRLQHVLLEARASGQLERDRRGVDRVERAVVERDLGVHDRVARVGALLHRGLDALLHGRDELARDRAADDGVDELERRAGRLGLEAQVDVAVLAGAARLLDVLVLALGGLRDRLAVGDLGRVDLRLDAVLALEAVDDDLEVELAHAGDDRLLRLLVVGHDEGRVLVRQRLQAHRELLGVGVRDGLDRDGDDGRRELDRLEHDRVVLVAERVARAGAREADERDDVARVGLLQRLLLLGVHADEARDALLLVAAHVPDGGARLELAGVDAGVDELAHHLVGDDLEGERGERLVVGGLAHRRLLALLLLLLRERAHDGRQVQRRGEEVDDRVEQRLHALVLERGAAEHRLDLALDGRLAQRAHQLLGRELAALEDALEERVVRLGRGLDHLLAPLLRLVHELGGDLALDDLEAVAALVEAEGLHADQVHDALEGVLLADRDDDRDGVAAEDGLHVLHAAEEVGADAVHLVHEDDLRDLVLLGLAPDLLGLGLDAGDGAEERDRAVEDAERALDLGREVDVSGGVDDRDLVVAPEARGGGGADGDAALLLLDHEVHRGGAVVHLAELVVLARVEEDALRGGGLAAVDVGHDADVAVLVERDLAWHCRIPCCWCARRARGFGLFSKGWLREKRAGF